MIIVIGNEGLRVRTGVYEADPESFGYAQQDFEVKHEFTTQAEVYQWSYDHVVHCSCEWCGLFAKKGEGYEA